MGPCPESSSTPWTFSYDYKLRTDLSRSVSILALSTPVSLPMRLPYWNYASISCFLFTRYVLCPSSPSRHFTLTTTKTNSVVWVRERTIPTERKPLVGEVSAKLYGKRVPCGQHDGSLRPYSRISRPAPLIFLSRSSSIVLTRLSGLRSKPTTSQINLVTQRIESGPLDL
jgi:hypothetical protein